MIAAGNSRKADRLQLIAFAGAGVAVFALLLNLDFFSRPGTDEVLTGLLHHAFVLGCMLILTAGSRTVSVGTLGVFWLLGVWSVYAVSYLVEDMLGSIAGASGKDELMLVWLAPLAEETTKLLPVALYFLLASRAGRHPSMSDGMLLGFMVGAGVSFQEDAQFGETLVSGDGWSAATPWTAVFPTISPLDSYFALNHALWAAISGLSIGVAMMLRPWRWAWVVAFVGPVLSFTNHLMSNQFTYSEFGVNALLNRAQGRDVPWFYDLVRDVSFGGRLPMAALILGALAVVLAERVILKSTFNRDQRFPPLTIAFGAQLLRNGATRDGMVRIREAQRYLSLRRSFYFARWRFSQPEASSVLREPDVAAVG